VLRVTGEDARPLLHQAIVKFEEGHPAGELAASDPEPG
jgi:hypothetical protein